MFSSEFFRIAISIQSTQSTNYTDFFEACLEEYVENDISSKKLCKLTPRQSAVAICVELSLLSSAEGSVFEKRVYELLENLKVGDGTFSLNLVNVLYEFLCTCGDFSHTEFAQATFDSMYNTRVAKDDFDVNFHLTMKEANTTVDGANLSQLIKTWIFMMSEMFYRFFYTYDPRSTDGSKAYYTVLHDTEKRKRTCEDFIYFLNCIRPIYAQLCLISADKSEIHSIFSKAAAEAKAIAEKRREKRDAMRSQLTGKRSEAKSPAKKAVHVAAPKPQITLAERMKQLDSNLKKIQNPSEKLVVVLPPAPVSAWKTGVKPWQKKEDDAKPVAVVPTAESESDSEEEVEAKPVPAAVESDGEGEFVVVNSRKTKTPVVTVEVKKNSTGRTHRVFSAMNKKQ